MLQRVTYLLLGLVLYANCHAQAPKNTDEQLAMQFYYAKEYDKAVIYFEKLYDKNHNQYYPKYYECLLLTKDFSRAEKIVKRQIKSQPANLSLLVDLGSVYSASNEPKKAEEQYQKAIKEISGDINQIMELGRAFHSARLFDYAIDTYKKGRRFTSGVYPFYYELAELYREKGDVKGMINEYLDALQFRETEMTNVQIQLQNNLGYDDDKGGFNHPVLKQELMKRIQTNPDKTIFSEFLIFIQLQQKDFEGAFIQAKALDKRNKEDGFRLLDLGRTCVANEDYEVAEKCFDYVIAKGESTSYYLASVIEASNAQFDRIVKKNNYTRADLTQLEGRFKSTIDKYGKNSITIPLLRKLAYLQAFYLSNSDGAIQLLNETLTIPGLTQMQVAEIKLDLGDVLIVAGDIWEASLMYSQVEKQFKHETIGQEAKFRNAKVSYYAGDFKWAKAQLDVLKGATSKLIANDAMDLSLVISDAIGIDTNVVPLQMFSSADLLLIQNKFAEGLARLDSINLLFSDNTLADDIYFRKARVFVKQGKFTEALEALKRIVEVYGDEIYGDDALFKMAEIYQENLNDNDKARELYQELIVKYPGSVYTVDARKRFRKLRGDAVN